MRGPEYLLWPLSELAPMSLETHSVHMTTVVTVLCGKQPGDRAGSWIGRVADVLEFGATTEKLAGLHLQRKRREAYPLPWDLRHEGDVSSSETRLSS